MVWVTPPTVCPTVLWTVPVPSLHNQSFTSHTSAPAQQEELKASRESSREFTESPEPASPCVFLIHHPLLLQAHQSLSITQTTHTLCISPSNLFLIPLGFLFIPNASGAFCSRDHHLGCVTCGMKWQCWCCLSCFPPLTPSAQELLDTTPD